MVNDAEVPLGSWSSCLFRSPSIEKHVEISKSIARLCFSMTDIQDCLTAIWHECDRRLQCNDPLELMDTIIIFKVDGVHFAYDNTQWNGMCVFFRGQHLQYELDIERAFHVPEIQGEVLRFMTRVCVPDTIRPFNPLGDGELEVEDMLTVSPSKIRGSPRLQRIMAAAFESMHEDRSAFGENNESLLQLLSSGVRSELREVLMWRVKKRKGLWQVVHVLSALEGVDIPRSFWDNTYIDHTRRVCTWIPVSIQRQELRRFFAMCVSADDPAAALASGTLPSYILHRDAWAKEVTDTHVEIIIQAAQRFGDADTVWAIVQHVAIESLVDKYLEEIRSYGRHAVEALFALGLLSTHTVRARGSVLVAAWAHVPSHHHGRHELWQAIEFVAWKHGIQLMTEDGVRGECDVASSLYHQLEYTDLLRLKVDVVEYGRSLNSCEYLNSFFNTDPRFIAEMLVLMAEPFGKLSFTNVNGQEIPFPITDTIATIEKMPRCLLEKVAGHRLSNGRLFMEEFVVRSTGLGHTYRPLLERMLWLDAGYIGSDVVGPFVDAWGVLNDAVEADETSDNRSFSRDIKRLLAAVRYRFRERANSFHTPHVGLLVSGSQPTQ